MVKVLFSDKCTMSHREVDFLSSPHTTDRQSLASVSRSHHSCCHPNDGGYDRDMEVDDDVASHHPSNQSRFEELNSPLRSQIDAIRTMQGGHSVKRPLVPPGPGDHGSRVPECVKLIGKSTMLSLVTQRNVILLTLNSWRQAGLWPKECSIHLKLRDGLPRRLKLSWRSI